ncbi:MAG: ribose-5-phosphate isomerase RpiA [Candidatus Korarchaeum sp.]|jgi:ribose 5-phosphate isomerase A|nr:ribose-5-phosphate isomerase RpiA [Candidatus Korarchaeum sp.]
MIELEKRVVAREALKLIGDARLVGLGSGSTVAIFVEELAKSDRADKVSVIPSSKQIEEVAKDKGLKVIHPDDERPEITIDGADEIDSNLNLLKGGGGALLREKVLAYNSSTYVIIADHTKLVEKLCSKRALPVEVLPYGISWTLYNLKRKLNCDAGIRMKDLTPFITDNGNLIVDISCPPIEDPASMESEIKGVPGVVEVGIFVGLADLVLIARGSEVKVIRQGF